ERIIRSLLRSAPPVVIGLGLYVASISRWTACGREFTVYRQATSIRATATGANATLSIQINILAWRKGDSPCHFVNERNASLTQSVNVSFCIGCCEGASRREAKRMPVL